MFDSVTPDEIDFLRLLLKCDANLNQEKKHLKTKLARRDFTEYVESIAKLRLMLGVLENDPKRHKTDADLVEYRNRVSYLDKTLTALEVESMPAPMEMEPPAVDPVFATKESEEAAMGGCIFKKAAVAPADEPMTGGCIFKKAATAPSTTGGVCPISGAKKAPQEGTCPVSGKGKSIDDMFKESENMSGCPMFQASPEEAEQIRREAAGYLDAPVNEETKTGRCPMTGAAGQATGCPMAQPGDHPELDGTWMAPVSDDPEACPTFLPRPILEPPKYSGVKTKKMKADDGLAILEAAENDVRAVFDFTLEKIRAGEIEELDEKSNVKATEDASFKISTNKSSVEQIQEWPLQTIQSFFVSHIAQIWMASAVLVLAYVAAKLTL